MIISGDTLRILRPIDPFLERTKAFGMTFGVGPAGYDVRIDQDMDIAPGDFQLGSTMEQFRMPNNVLGIVHDKSTWARRGLALQNTVIEPGWEGWLTLELSNHGSETLHVYQGMPIAQIIFHAIDVPVAGYKGKYQFQPRGPQPAQYEE